jgi:hypothetical protein
VSIRQFPFCSNQHRFRREEVLATRLFARLLHHGSAKKKEKRQKVVAECQRHNANYSVAPHQPSNCPSNGISPTLPDPALLNLDDINSPTAFVAAITAKQRAQRPDLQQQPSTSSLEQNGQISASTEANPYRVFQKESQHYFQEPPNWNPGRFREEATPPPANKAPSVINTASSGNSEAASKTAAPKKKVMLRSDVAL